MYSHPSFIKQLIIIPLAVIALSGCNNAEHHEDDQKDTIQKADTAKPEMVINKPDTPAKVSAITPPPPPPVIPRTKDYTPPIVALEEEEMVDVEPSQENINYMDMQVAETSEPEVFIVVEEMPQFPGGQAALYEFIKTNLRYPPLAVESGIEGRVIVKFIVTKTGEIKDAVVLKHIQLGTGEEALRIVNSMPRWIPGKQRGRPVDVWYTLPIKFESR